MSLYLLYALNYQFIPAVKRYGEKLCVSNNESSFLSLIIFLPVFHYLLCMNEFHKCQPLSDKGISTKKGGTSPNLEIVIVVTQNYRDWRMLPVSIIRQGSLFDLQELYDLEPTQ